jgi:hypothetical protein
MLAKGVRGMPNMLVEADNRRGREEEVWEEEEEEEGRRTVGFWKVTHTGRLGQSTNNRDLKFFLNLKSNPSALMILV